MRKFQFVVNELLEWDSGEARVGKHHVDRWLVQIMFILRDVVRGKVNAETIHHYALRHAKCLTDL